MGHSEYDPAAKNRRPWNAGQQIGPKRALKPQQVWAIRFWLVDEWVTGIGLHRTDYGTHSLRRTKTSPRNIMSMDRMVLAPSPHGEG